MDTGRKLNVHKTFNLNPVSTGNMYNFLSCVLGETDKFLHIFLKSFFSKIGKNFQNENSLVEYFSTLKKCSGHLSNGENLKNLKLFWKLNMGTIVYYTIFLTDVKSRSHIYNFKYINESRNFKNNSVAMWENSHYQILGEILQSTWVQV